MENAEDIVEFYTDIDNLHFNTLYDGKLNRRFYSTFYNELMLSYFIPGKEKKYYMNPNMTLIKYLERNDLLLMKSSERRTSYSDEAILSEIGRPFKPHFYINEKKSKHLNQIYAPQNFTTHLKTDFFSDFNEKYNLKFVPKKISGCPQCILDFKSIINDNTINDFRDLSRNVLKFNDKMKNKLNEH